MQKYCNIPETFFREIRGVLIYDKSQISYINQLNGDFPNPSEALFQFRILPTGLDRKIPTKLKEDNIFFAPDIVFPLLDLDTKQREIWYKQFNRFNQYAVVLISNTEMMMLGSDRFPLSITITDNIRDDASGDDSFSLNIYGEMINPPAVFKIQPKFKVLFFLPPIQ